MLRYMQCYRSVSGGSAFCAIHTQFISSQSLQSVAFVFEYVHVLRIAYFAARQRDKAINFHGYGTPRGQRGGSTDPFVREAVYRKPVLRKPR